jgi:probable rRNA maturation factor
LHKATLGAWSFFTNFEIMSSKSKVYFFFERKGFQLENRLRLKVFLEKLFKQEGAKLGSLNYIFCTDERLLEINHQFLGHNHFTDIISFDLGTDLVQGEIYISIDRVKDNCKTYGVSFKQELHRVIFHGALHLCGYEDKTPAQLKTMKKKEDYYLQFLRST